MEARYDIAIIGSGPAGLSAALNSKIRNKRIIVFGSKELSSKLFKAPKVNNYLGFYNVNGKQMKEKFEEHMRFMDIEITYERVNNIYAMGDYYSLMVNDKVYEAASVIIATGMEYGKPFNGEENYLGKGVGYCATCDAPLYRGKTVAIIGYNKESEEEANYVSELVSKVYYIPMYKGEFDLNPNIEIIEGKPLEIKGDTLVKTLILDNKTLDVDGVFILRDAISPAQLVPGLEIQDNHIKVDRQMATNLKGCFAAGDCVGKPYQYIKAAGDGIVAALSAVSYLESIKRKN
jgi:thioredoxin reductase (NADPH)